MRRVIFMSLLLVCVALTAVRSQLTVTRLNPYSAIGGVTITNTGSNLLYNMAAGGYLRLLTFGTANSNQFAIDTQSAALTNTSSYVSVLPLSCPSCCTNGKVCSVATSLQTPITSQLVALRLSVAGCGSNVLSVKNPGQPWVTWGYFNIWGRVQATAPGTPVVGNCDSGVPENNEAFLFNSYDQVSGTFQILANNQLQSGAQCVQANIASGVANLVLAPCQIIPSQQFQLYGINIPSSSTLMPLETFLPGGSQSQAVLYSVGHSGVVVGGQQKVASNGVYVSQYTVVDFNSGITNLQARVSLQVASCPSQSYHTYCTQESSIVSPLLIALNFRNTVCNTSDGAPTQGRAFMNIYGGITNTVVGQSVINYCDSGINNNAVFYFKPIAVATNIYQIQAWNTNNGNLCVQALDNAEEVFELWPCDATNANQLWGLAIPQ